jgi:hypothetical protein
VTNPNPTEVDLYSPPPPPSVTNGAFKPPSVMRLTDWWDQARAASAIAERICETTFVPDHFRNKPAETTAAILTGFELGLTPMAALRAIYVIKGTPGMYANTMRAIVQSHGHRIWEEDITATRVIVCGQRRNESRTHKSTWTIDRAKQAGLTSNQQYQRNPVAMLMARATAEACRMTAADALHGLGISVEELETDPINPQPEPTPAVEASTKRTAKRAPLKATPSAPPEPDLDEEQPAPEVDPRYRPRSDAQQAKIFAAMGELGIKERDSQIAYIERVVKRKVDSRKGLTMSEAHAVIEHLEMDIQDRGEPQQDQPEQPEQPELQQDNQEEA